MKTSLYIYAERKRLIKFVLMLNLHMYDRLTEHIAQAAKSLSQVFGHRN